MAANLENARGAIQKARQSLMEKRNVVAVGIGYKIVAGKKTGDLSIICSVKEKVAKAQLEAGDLVPEMIDDVPTDVFESGEIVVHQGDPKAKLRPAPGGVSVGHVGITAGTLGMWVRKNGEFHILSNNHVLANQNTANIGDRILQPGPYDSGVGQIAELTDFVEIKFGGEDNFVDCALARAVEVDDPSGCPIAGSIANLLNSGASAAGRKTRMKPVKPQAIEDVVKDEILNIGKVTEITEALLDMEVKKMGRTTELTDGVVTQIDASTNVNFGNQSAYFMDQVITTDMSQGGDSGSVLVTKDDNKLVGLLFAGSATLTVHNRIQNVQSALNFTL